MYGIHVTMDILLKLREDLDELADNLDNQLRLTDQSIEDASLTWRDEKFVEFKAQFDDDKDMLIPLSSRIKDFNNGFLNDTIVRLDDYLR